MSKMLTSKERILRYVYGKEKRREDAIFHNPQD